MVDNLGSRTQLTWVTNLLGSSRLAGFNLGWTQSSKAGWPHTTNQYILEKVSGIAITGLN